MFFCVTIDNLFKLSDSAHFERIKNMLYMRVSLDSDEFSYAEGFLKEKNAKTLLARLYENRAGEYYFRQSVSGILESSLFPSFLRTEQFLSYLLPVCCPS